MHYGNPKEFEKVSTFTKADFYISQSTLLPTFISQLNCITEYSVKNEGM